MKKILIIGEKPSQIKKFKDVILLGSKSVQEDIKIFSYDGTWKGNLDTYQVKMIPLSGHIATIDTPEEFGWGKVDPIEIVKDPKALYFKENSKYKKILNANALLYDELYIATDPDSEGDNIGLEAYNILIRKNPRFKTNVKRIWNSSLTDIEIKRAFTATESANLGWDTRLGLSVQGRQIADAWLGFAGTREITQSARKVHRVKVFSVGRVQLPTLKMIVDRDLEHESFVPKPLWNLNATFTASNGSQFIATHTKNPFTEEKIANDVVAKIKNEKIGIVQNVENLRLQRKPPAPLNTTAALSLLARLFKFKAEEGLEILSDLYLEGLLSYPRTENAKFSDSFPHKDIIDKLKQNLKYNGLLAQIKSSTQVRTNGLAKGVEDHDPISPTGEIPALASTKITKRHLDVLEILTLYYIGMFMDDLVLDKVKLNISVKNEPFEAEGKTVVSEGWTEAITWQKSDDELLPLVRKQEQLPLVKLDKIKSATKPKPRLNDSTILKQMERLGLGTKSSRPAILEKLVERGYIIRNKTQFISQPSGRTLVSLLNPIWPDIVTNSFTKNVESKMDDVARGKTLYPVMLDQLKQEYIKLHQLLLTNLPSFVSSLQTIDSSLLGVNIQKDRFQSSNTSKVLKKDQNQNQKNFGTSKANFGLCPNCKTGNIIQRTNRTTNNNFYACDRYPNCKWTQSTEKGAPVKDEQQSLPIKKPENKTNNIATDVENIVCPVCKKGKLIIRTNRASGVQFQGCSNYPECKHTQKVN
jgi:DNA topoisomerase-1